MCTVTTATGCQLKRSQQIHQYQYQYPEVSLVKPDLSSASVCIEICLWNPTLLYPPHKPTGSYMPELFLFLNKSVNTQLRLFISSSPEQA